MPHLPNILVACAALSVDAVRKVVRSVSARTSFGDVVGGQSVDGCQYFKGIPFAEPPVGDLRFENPEPWQRAYSGVLDATNTGAECIQQNGNGDEDCLFLNIWRPIGAQAGAKLPVMVYIHGGAFVTGAGGVKDFDSCHIAANENVVVVTLNYRLGVFGFGTFQSGGSVSTNWGLKDQREGLKWLQREVNSFGGDGDKITLFGESAGGISIYHHLVAPASLGLFRGAIVISGYPAGKELAPALETTKELGAKLGCNDVANLKACMRSQSPKTIQNKEPQHNIFDADFRLFQRYEPVVDGVELPAHSSKMIANGKSHPVPLIAGSNTDEATAFSYLLYLLPMNDRYYRKTVMEQLTVNPGNPQQNLDIDEVGRVLETYPEQGSLFADNRGRLAEMMGDAMFVCTTLFGARMHSQSQKTWSYRFNYRPQACKTLPQRIVPGVFHGMHVPFIFNNTGRCRPEANALAMSRRMQGYFANFAKFLNPNGASATTWPAFNPSTRKEIVFQPEDQIEERYKADVCSFWEDILLSKVL